VATVEFTAAAVASLERLVVTHSLPADTWRRVWASVEPLERFPDMGAMLGPAWAGARFILGPWRWMIVVYRHLEPEGRVIVVAIEDGRSSRFAG
jgi:plasmid stabilization system protein ParE